MCWLCWLPVGLFPPFNIFLLALLAPGEVFRVFSLLYGMPIVQHPIRGHHLTSMSHTTRRISNCRINFFFFFKLIGYVEGCLLNTYDVKMCSSFVCSLMNDAVFLSLHVMPNILSIPLWELWKFCSRTFVRPYDSNPYVRTGTMHWLYTFLFSDSKSLLFIILYWLPKVLHPIPILFHDLDTNFGSSELVPEHILLPQSTLITWFAM